MKDQSQIIPQSLRAASKQPLDGRIRFNTLEAALLEAYDGAIFYIVSLGEWYKFKLNAEGGLDAIADSAIDASLFATKTDIDNFASNSVASASAAGLMSVVDFVKLRDIIPANITKVRASATNGNIRINDEEVIVYTRPNTSTDRPVSDDEKTAWNGKADGVHVHNNYSPTTHNHDNVYAPKEHEHQVWDAVLGRYREKYVLADTQGSGGDATSLSGLALNNNATGDVANDAIWSANKVLGVVNAKVSELATGLAWKASVNTYADIATTYPNPEDGWTTIAKDTDKTWRFNGSTWEDISVTIIPLATPLVDGKMSAADKSKLDGIAEGANNYVHPESHLASMITEETNKRFLTDAQREYINNISGVITGTYTKLASDYQEGKIYIEQVVDANIGVGTTQFYQKNGVLHTYVGVGRTYTSQVFFSATYIVYVRSATSGGWNSWYVQYNGANLFAASSSNQGLMTADDKTKLDGIATAATNTPLGSTNPETLGTASPGVSTSAARADHVHPLPSIATTSADGLMSATDKIKLDSKVAIDNGLVTDDLNTLIKSGMYRVYSTNANIPSGCTNGNLIVSRGADTILQIIASYSSPKMYFRYGNPAVVGGGGDWSSWVELYHKSNLVAATTSNDGLMSIADKTKLDGIATGATNTPLGSTNGVALGSASPGVSTSAARADHVHPLPAIATTSANGLMSATDKTKLDDFTLTQNLTFDSSAKSSSFSTTYLSGRKMGKLNYITGRFLITSNYSGSPQLLTRINGYLSPGHTVYFALSVKQTAEGSTGYIDTAGNIYIYWGVANASDYYMFNAFWIEP